MTVSVSEGRVWRVERVGKADPGCWILDAGKGRRHYEPSNGLQTKGSVNH